MTPSPSPVTASVVRRLSAMFYDALLLFAVLFAATLIPALVLQGGQSPDMENGVVVHDLHPLLSGFPYQIYLLTISTLFLSWFWRRNGQTLGMQAWRLKLENLEGGTISWRQCAVRLAVGALSLLLCGAGYWWAWFDKDRRSWHDIASKSRVVLLPKSR